ncbi:MFS transporter [Niveibacterium sp. SC-1]|uniref:MFS transporter n=1 Tax=Niveibacterium sp. SC-1 TaxID=3135646 RepID=UPI00311E2408
MTTLTANPPRAARFAVQAHFFINGLLFATWGVHVPTVRAQYGLSDAQLSYLMLAAAVGAIISLMHVGGWIARFGARRVLLVAGMALSGALASLFVMPGYLALLPLLLVFGLGNSAFDVAMNTEAVEVERAYGRPIMSAFHGFFSLGGLAGAGIGSLIAMSDITPTLHVVVTAVIAYVLIGYATTHMLPDSHTQTDDKDAHGFSLPPRAVVLLGVLCALGFVGEGAMYDWSTLYMAKDLGSPQTIAAWGYGAFSAFMAAGRFGGDFIRARLGGERTLRLSAWLAAVSMLAALALHHPVAALIGFSFAGLGFANMVPVLFSAAANVPGISAGRGIAGVASCGYFGFLAGPPLIGGIAQVAGLPYALVVVGVVCVLIALLCKRAMHSHA